MRRSSTHRAAVSRPHRLTLRGRARAAVTFAVPAALILSLAPAAPATAANVASESVESILGSGLVAALCESGNERVQSAGPAQATPVHVDGDSGPVSATVHTQSWTMDAGQRCDIVIMRVGDAVRAERRVVTSYSTQREATITLDDGRTGHGHLGRVEGKKSLYENSRHPVLNARRLLLTPPPGVLVLSAASYEPTSTCTSGQAACPEQGHTIQQDSTTWLASVALEERIVRVGTPVADRKEAIAFKKNATKAVNSHHRRHKREIRADIRAQKDYARTLPPREAKQVRQGAQYDRKVRMAAAKKQYRRVKASIRKAFLEMMAPKKTWSWEPVTETVDVSGQVPAPIT